MEHGNVGEDDQRRQQLRQLQQKTAAADVGHAQLPGGSALRVLCFQLSNDLKNFDAFVDRLVLEQEQPHVED